MVLWPGEEHVTCQKSAPRDVRSRISIGFLRCAMVGARSLPFVGGILFALGCGSGDDRPASALDGGNDSSIEGGDGANTSDGGLALQMGQRLPTGDFLTPTASRGSMMQELSPMDGLLADHAASTVISPDGKTL